MHLESQPSSTLVAALSSRRFLAIRSFAVSGWQWFRLGAMVGFEVEEKSGIPAGPSSCASGARVSTTRAPEERRRRVLRSTRRGGQRLSNDSCREQEAPTMATLTSQGASLPSMEDNPNQRRNELRL